MQEGGLDTVQVGGLPWDAEAHEERERRGGGIARQGGAQADADAASLHGVVAVAVLPPLRGFVASRHLRALGVGVTLPAPALRVCRRSPPSAAHRLHRRRASASGEGVRQRRASASGEGVRQRRA